MKTIVCALIFFGAFCAGCENGQRVVVRNTNCAFYDECVNGAFILRRCDFGSIFDTRFHRCLPIMQGMCQDRACAEGVALEDPLSERSYYACHGGQLALRLCPVLMVFDLELGACSPMGRRHAGCREGEKRLQGDCSSYLECRKGEWVKQACGWSKHFDSELKSCVPKATAKCEPASKEERVLRYPRRKRSLVSFLCPDPTSTTTGSTSEASTQSETSSGTQAYTSDATTYSETSSGTEEYTTDATTHSETSSSTEEYTTDAVTHYESSSSTVAYTTEDIGFSTDATQAQEITTDDSGVFTALPASTSILSSGTEEGGVTDVSSANTRTETEDEMVRGTNAFPGLSGSANKTNDSTGTTDSYKPFTEITYDDKSVTAITAATAITAETAGTAITAIPAVTVDVSTEVPQTISSSINSNEGHKQVTAITAATAITAETAGTAITAIPAVTVDGSTE